jgi:hypothetical protein
MLCNASITSLAMFTSKRHAYHAGDTKVLIVKFPQAQQLINHSFLFGEPSQFGDIAWLEHSAEVEIAAESVA